MFAQHIFIHIYLEVVRSIQTMENLRLTRSRNLLNESLTNATISCYSAILLFPQLLRCEKGNKKGQTDSVGRQIRYEISLKNLVSKSHALSTIVTMRYIELLLNIISHYLLTLGETYGQKDQILCPSQSKFNFNLISFLKCHVF